MYESYKMKNKIFLKITTFYKMIWKIRKNSTHRQSILTLKYLYSVKISQPSLLVLPLLLVPSSAVDAAGGSPLPLPRLAGEHLGGGHAVCPLAPHAAHGALRGCGGGDTLVHCGCVAVHAAVTGDGSEITPAFLRGL